VDRKPDCKKNKKVIDFLKRKQEKQEKENESHRARVESDKIPNLVA